ncbi:MAG: hypothetical protein LLG00_10775 [Planctomycetaceae bacterium]|nr:hypothetical protein [Planctomycetaceae bacterium]
MRLFRLIPVILICSLSSAAATAQDRAATTPSGTERSAANVSQTQDAIDRAAAANKYAFVFFWSEQSAQLDKAWSALKPAVAKMADVAVFVSVRVTNPAEKNVVDKYHVGRAPLPLVLAIAPCGAITKAFTKTFDEKELRTAFVSPCTQRSLKALQDGKLVFVSVVEKAGPKGTLTAPRGVKDFKADKNLGPATEIVLVNAEDDSEADFLKTLKISKFASKPMTAFFAPPGVLIGTFGDAPKDVFVAKLAAARSGSCSGGKCGPQGCGAKH